MKIVGYTYKRSKKLSLKLEKSRKELRNTLNNEDLSIKKIFDISSDLDEEILFQVKFNECDKIVKNAESKKIVNKIRQDLLKHYYGMSEQEVIILSLNIFDYCYLKAQNITEDNIVRYICTKNAIYHDILTEKEKNSFKVELNLRFFKHLIEKYTNILKKEQ